MTDLLLPAVLTAGTGLVMAALARPVLLTLPEPAAAGDKAAYRDLPTRRFVLGCVLAAMTAQVLAVIALPPDVLPLWTVLATVGVLLAAIDARTTWLPLRLTHAAWWLMALAAGVALALGLPAADALRSIAGAGVAGALYLVIWAVTRGGFGFGDVRFAPLLGAATASHSWSLLIWGLTLGTAVGAVHGAARLARRRVGGFPYAPSMLTGCYLAVVALMLLLPEP